MTFREFLLRVRAWTRRRQLGDQLDAEFEHHLAMLARDLEHEQGHSPADARVEARRRLGNTTVLRESSRDAWGFPAIDALLQDVR
ncbi:MAG TPA: permease prefix domain 1-containing protein, partial [Gemmatimonadaceae bacterium]